MKSNEGQQVVKEEPRFGLKVIETEDDFVCCSSYGRHPLEYNPPEEYMYAIPVRVANESKHAFDLFIRYLLFMDYVELPKLLNYHCSDLSTTRSSLLLMQVKEQLVYLRTYLNTPLLIVDGKNMENTDYPEILARIDNLLELLNGYTPSSGIELKNPFVIKEKYKDALNALLSPMISQNHKNWLLDFLSNKRGKIDRIEFNAAGNLICSIFRRLIDAGVIDSSLPMGAQIVIERFSFVDEYGEESTKQIFQPKGGGKLLSPQQIENKLLTLFPDNEEIGLILDHLDLR